MGRALSCFFTAGAALPLRPLARRNRAGRRSHFERPRSVSAPRESLQRIPQRRRFHRSTRTRPLFKISAPRSPFILRLASPAGFRLPPSPLVHELRLPRRLRRARKRHFRLGRHPLFLFPRARGKRPTHLARRQWLDHPPPSRTPRREHSHQSNGPPHLANAPRRKRF